MRKNYPYYNCNQINNLKEMLDISIQNGNDVAFLYKNYKNEHIAIVGENSYNYLVLFLSIILSGNVAVLIDKDLSEEAINKLLKISDTIKNGIYKIYGTRWIRL